jgi:ABC-type multidrug transport system ATPase subunit
MIQAVGLTSTPRGDRPPAVGALSFEAPPGRTTVLHGPPGAGKSTALRLMLGLEPGRGVAYFRGNVLHRVEHPAHEVGVLLGDAPGHPARTVRGRLRMQCAAAGVPLARAGEVLTAMGLAGAADERLGTLPLGLDRRLGIASALLADPHALILDEPFRDLAPRERDWLRGVLRAHAGRGGTVLLTSSDPHEAATVGDRVVTLARGRLVADQEGTEFARTRLRPRVAVRTPYAERLADLVRREARTAGRTVETRTGPGALLHVYGSSPAEVGETAFRHRILVHRLTEETGDEDTRDPGDNTTAKRGTGAVPTVLPPPLPGTDHHPGPGARPGHPAPALYRSGAPARTARPDTPTPGEPRPRPVRGPLRPIRYEALRLLGVPETAVLMGAALLVSLILSLLMARSAAIPATTAAAAWPGFLPLPPAALAAGALGALSFAEELRDPAPLAARGTASRGLALLLARLTVTGAAALLTALLTAASDTLALRLVYGTAAVPPPDNWPALAAGWAALTVGCAWAGVLAAGAFRAAAAGLAAVLAVPVLVVPLVGRALDVSPVRSAAGLPDRLLALLRVRAPGWASEWPADGLRLLAQPFGVSLMLSIAVLSCVYLPLAHGRRAARRP